MPDNRRNCCLYHRRRSVILSVCPHDKTKMYEIKIAILGMGIVRHDTSPTNY